MLIIINGNTTELGKYLFMEIHNKPFGSIYDKKHHQDEEALYWWSRVVATQTTNTQNLVMCLHNSLYYNPGVSRLLILELRNL